MDYLELLIENYHANSNKEFLIVDSCEAAGLYLDLNESAEKKGGSIFFRGKFQEAEAVNKNKRIYPFSVLDENVKALQAVIRENRLVGELDHPTDSIVHYKDASHLITKLWWEGTVLMGEGKILNTPHGRILKGLIEDGVKVGISSRGVGNGKVNENGVLVIGESYKLITFDAVADPSCHAAFQERVVGQHEHIEQPRPDNRNLHNSVIKNESQRIDTVSKEAIIACLGGIFKSQVEQVKARLS